MLSFNFSFFFYLKVERTDIDILIWMFLMNCLVNAYQFLEIPNQTASEATKPSRAMVTQSLREHSAHKSIIIIKLCHCALVSLYVLLRVGVGIEFFHMWHSELL